MTAHPCPWCSVGYDPESRFTWDYVDSVRRFAKEHGTLDQPNVKALLELLEIGTRLRQVRRQLDVNPSPLEQPKGLQQPDAQGDDHDHVDQLHDHGVDGELLDTPQQDSDDHQHDQD